MRPHRLLDPLLLALPALNGRSEPARGLLLVSFGGLGDTVLLARLLPRFMELAQPGETVTILLRSDAARMSFLFPAGIVIKAVDLNRLRQLGYRRRIFAELYRAHYRLVIHTDYLRHPDLDEALVAAAHTEAVAMEPRPWPKYQRRLDANRRLYGRLYESGAVVTDKILRWSAFADFLTGRTVPPPTILLPPEQMPEPARLQAPTVVLQPFSAVAGKHSPLALWRRIIETIPAGWHVRVAGHPSDLDRNPEYRSLFDLPGVSFEPAPFRELAPILRAARLVVSVDTACMHLATALGTPTLCLASAAYVGEIVPYAAQVMPANLTVLMAECPHQCCLGDCKLPAKQGMYPCIAALDPALVLAAVKKLVEAP